MSANAADPIEAEVDAWAKENWDPDLSVADWWQRLADSGYAAPMLPENAGGKGWSRGQAKTALRTLANNGCMGPPAGLGMMLAAPTIAHHGTQEQIEEYVKPILNGQRAWCQLFSEPGAGSDLAGLNCKAELDGEEWTINGQKVWTSGGQVADMGMLIARTDPNQPKHVGISYFAFDMHQDGVDVRPLTEMTGRAMFNEVFITDGRVHNDAMIGEKGNGWRVANTTLMEERAHLGSGSVRIPTTLPGTIAGNLDKRAGDIVESRSSGGSGVPPVGPGLLEVLVEVSKKLGNNTDPILRQELMKLHSKVHINTWNMLRARHASQRSGAEGNIAKLMMSDMFREFREVGNMVVGADGMIGQQDATVAAWLRELTLFSPARPYTAVPTRCSATSLASECWGCPKNPATPKRRRTPTCRRTADSVPSFRRPAARVVVLDPLGRVFLMQGSDPMRPENGTWWEIPGGGMDSGEDSADTAARELYEECGFKDARMGPCVWTQYVEFDFAMYHFKSDERIHVAWVDEAQDWDPQALEALEAAAFEDGKWWSVEELMASNVATLPARLREFLPALSAGTIPDEPIDISPPLAT